MVMMDSAHTSVFLSYSRRDEGVAQRIGQLLRVGGADVFRDRDSIQPGREWALVIAEAVAGADRVLVLWSRHAAGSDAVAHEYGQAIAAGKAVVPVLLDATPLPPALASYQWVDCREFMEAGVQDIASQFGWMMAESAARPLLLPHNLMRRVLNHFAPPEQRLPVLTVRSICESDLMRRLARALFETK
jgi:hypothetical protein